MGNDFGEDVGTGELSIIDSDVDVVETLGGNDNISSGSPTGVENHDLVSTGAGSDWVYYMNPSGELVDNGTGADTHLAFGSVTPHAWLIDNVGRSPERGRPDHADLDRRQRRFGPARHRGTRLPSVASDGDETLVVDGLERGAHHPWRRPSARAVATTPSSSKTTCQARLDMGTGADGLLYQVYSACRSATITMDRLRRLHDRGGIRSRSPPVWRASNASSAQTRHRLDIVGTARSRRHHRQQPSATRPQRCEARTEFRHREGSRRDGMGRSR